jgi:apolipoprotein N-acyltransferase
MILGADDAVPRPDDPEQPDYFNSGFLLDPQGRLAARYDKRQLVMFGEYVPLARWLPFLKYLTPIEGGFRAGTRPAPFELTSLRARTSVLICFEDAFARLAREAVEPDTDFLVNLTNDGWFGRSAAQWQHAANAVFRAVENGLPLVRCTNNGLTCWIDPQGRIHGLRFRDAAEVYGAGFKIIQLPLPPAGQRRTPTAYHRHGDRLGWSCVGLVAVTLAWLALDRRGRPAA